MLKIRGNREEVESAGDSDEVMRISTSQAGFSKLSGSQEPGPEGSLLRTGPVAIKQQCAS